MPISNLLPVHGNAAKSAPYTVLNVADATPTAAETESTVLRAAAVTNVLRCQWTVSAAGNTAVEIDLHEPLNVIGFLNGTAKFCRLAEFYVDENFLGLCSAAHEVTETLQLTAGVHKLEVRAPDGEDFCDAVWGFEPAAEFLQPAEKYVTVAAILKNDPSGLEEWIQHHRSIGVEHFYLVNRVGKFTEDPRPLDPNFVVGANCADSTVVTMVAWEGQEDASEAEIYGYIFEKYAAQCQWMALLETNEFLVVKLGTSLARYLQAFGDYGALKLSRRAFVADGQDSLPHKVSGCSGSQSFFLDHEISFIVQPRFVVELKTAHHITMMPGRDAVGEYFEEGVSDLHLQLNHYCTSSDDEPIGNLFWDNSMADLWRRQATRARPAAEAVPVFGYIHLAAMGHWRSILNSQLNKCMESGLWDRTSEIRVGIVGGNERTLDELRGLPEKVKILFCDPDLRKFEFPTLQALQAACEEDRLSYAWYIHSKGAVNNYKAQQGWRARMEEFILVHHDLAVERLDAGYHTAAGFGGVDHRWHVPGNFYWVRSDHTLRLPKVASLNWNDRWDAEKWIGMGGFSGMYFQDFGATVMDYLKIVSATAAAGVVSTCGYHGWEQSPPSSNRIPVLVSKNLPAFDHVISAHAPSKIEIVIEKPATCFGFICGSGRAFGWTLEFLVNGNQAGKKKVCNSATPGTVLPPGKHTLEIMASGDIGGAHSVWGLQF